MSHPTVKLALESVIHFLHTGKPLPYPQDLSEEFHEESAVFVSIKKNHKLRGCVGSTTPQTKSLGSEIIRNAVSAATKDPRFPPISKMELSNLTFSVDVLTPLEAVKDISALDPNNYGLAIRQDSKFGLLLPDLDGITTVEKQIEICKNKAGIAQSESVTMFRFRVNRYF